jgi:plasmid stability protein
MGTLTIRNLEDMLKRRLRLRAAARNRSMEEEARQILRAALLEAAVPESDLASRIRSRFADVGDVELTIAPREPVRLPPDLSRSPSGPGPARRAATPRPARRR